MRTRTLDKKSVGEQLATNAQIKIRNRVLKDVFYENRQQEQLNEDFIEKILTFIDVPIGIAEGAKIEILNQIMKLLKEYWCIPKQLIDESEVEKII